MSTSLKNIIAPTPAVTRGKSVFVNGDPKGNNILYACGNAIIIRSINDPKTADIYYEHPCATTTAKYSPSGNYIASGDVQGNLRIWDTLSKDHILKITLKVLSGPILDLAWTSDNQRLIVVGDGKEKFGVAILWDSGASCGEISGHGKLILSCDVKSTRPFRAATGSEDFKINWFEGPPFKFNKMLAGDHTRYVNCVRFSPDGNKLVAVSSDKKGEVFDGKTGDKLVDLSATNAHTGGIYCVSWSADNNRILTSSADKTSKIWDTTTGECLKTFTFGNEISDQQLGCLWQGDNLLSINLEGEISYLDESNPEKPKKVIKGHNKLISTAAYDSNTQSLFSASYDASLLQWDISTGLATNFTGDAHKNQISSIKIRGNDIITCAMDDTVKISNISTRTYGPSIAIDSPGQGVAYSDNVIVAVSMKTIYVIKGGKIVSNVSAPWEPTSVAVNGNEVSVGGKDNKIHVYKLNGDSLAAAHTLEAHRGAVLDLVYSSCGKLLASCCGNREVIVWEGQTQKSKSWVNHSARVNSISFAPDSKHLVSGGLDGQVYFWDIEKPTTSPIQIKNAHLGGVNDVVFINGNEIASTGNDGAIKFWNVKF